jgi:hypothetical protein
MPAADRTITVSYFGRMLLPDWWANGPQRGLVPSEKRYLLQSSLAQVSIQKHFLCEDLFLQVERRQYFTQGLDNPSS